MNIFCCAIRCDGASIPSAWRERFTVPAACRGLELHHVERPGFWGFVAGDAAGRLPSTHSLGARSGIGMARLDTEPRGGSRRVSDLRRILDCWPTTADEVRSLQGDFAVVLHDEQTRRTVAIRDAFGVDALYYRILPGGAAFASRADMLAENDEAYDHRFLAEFLAGADHADGGTPFEGVSAVPAAHLARLVSGRVVLERWWSPERFVEVDGRPAETLIEEFRARFAAAVRSRLEPGPRATWAQLSGGLDSSSVVCMASALARRGRVPYGLAGTVTLVDRHGTGGDERRFSDAVVTAYGVPNEQLLDDAWSDGDDDPPPRTDRPTPAYLAYARDRRLAMIVRRAGGEVLLSGYGSDHYLGGSAIFLADWAARGQFGAVARELVHWAVVGRVSVWSLAWSNVAVPLLPNYLMRRALGAARVPPWIVRSAVRAYGLDARTIVALAARGPRRHKYTTNVLRAINDMPNVLALHAVLQDTVEERHPFLDRQLVELSLGFPPTLCAQPCARKWVLREAMRGIVPEVVRTRHGKGSIDGAFAHWLVHKRGHINRLLEHAMIGQLGLVDQRALAAAVERAAHGAPDVRASLARTLALECWLLARSGRWTATGRGTTVGRSTQFTSTVGVSSSGGTI